MRNKIKFRLYQIDKGLPYEIIEDYLSLEADGIDPKVYRFVWESLEDPDLDKLYSKYSKDDRPNNHVCRSIDVSDVIEIEDKLGASTYYISDLFGWTEIEFDKSQMEHEMGFQKMYVNMDSEMKRVLCTDWSAKAVIEIMVKRLGKSRRIVALMFHQSETYKSMFTDKTGFWERPYQIVDAFEKEIKELKE